MIDTSKLNQIGSYCTQNAYLQTTLDRAMMLDMSNQAIVTQPQLCHISQKWASVITIISSVCFQVPSHALS